MLIVFFIYCFRLPLKLSTAENTLQGDVPKKTPIRIYKVQTNKTTERKSPECQLANENTDQNIHEEEQQHNGTLDKTNEQDKPTEEQDNMTEENESEDLSLEVSVFDILKETKAKANNKKASGNKRSQDSSSAKTRKSSTKKTIFSEELKGVDKPNQESKSKESRAKKRLSSKRHEENISENDASVSADVVFDANDSGHSDIFLNPESGLLEMKESSDPEVSEQEEKPKKNPKKKVTKDKANSLNDEKKAKKDPKPKKTVRKQPPKQRKESPKSATMEAIVTVITESPNSSPLRVLPESPVKKTPGKIVDDTVSKSNLPTPKSSPQVSTNEPDDFLGDMGFLIDMSSMISSFVSSESQQIELPLMQARERSDARKLVALFNLHISIGNKSDNRSSLILSKTSNSQMPKPGKLDNLLSKLSIAAAKEAERLSSKARTKRKFASIGDDASLSDTDSQPKRAGKSKNKKAKM